MSWIARSLASAALSLTLSALAAPVALNGALAADLTGIGWDGKPVSTVTATASATGRPIGSGIGWDGVGASVVAPTGASLGDGIGWD
ncbi:MULTISPECIES: hypothetical protein [unclassified Streptomyces]|uniref:hypothetical protein n=1 Tax=unclassified Streptomyces TaxID=2593676 RepID=UPI002E0DE54A|nr:hypothetical protein OG573_41860 [Streptomyces sp. NBC_01205]